jgi:hypothetical protein
MEAALAAPAFDSPFQAHIPGAMGFPVCRAISSKQRKKQIPGVSSPNGSFDYPLRACSKAHL